MGMEGLTAEIFPGKLARLESQRVSRTKVLENRRLSTKVNEEIGGMAREGINPRTQSVRCCLKHVFRTKAETWFLIIFHTPRVAPLRVVRGGLPRNQGEHPEIIVSLKPYASA